MKMSIIRAFLAAAALIGVITPADAADDQRPNVLWIIADDLGIELGCYGQEHVATPHLDRLAREGVRFTRAFATSPVCSSSRTAFITGMYQTTIGGHPHRTRKLPELPDAIRPATTIFRDAGYYVCNMNRPTGTRGKAKIDYNFQHENLFDGNDWRGRAEGQPFFAQLQIKEPHRPFVSDTSPDRWKQIELPPQYPDHPITRRDWANYLASIEVMDAKVGEVLDRLDAEGIADNTLVVFFGDHGRPHVWGKQWLYEGGIHVPLIVRWPGRLQPGTVDERMVSLIDLAPTSLAAAGIEPPEVMQGVDFLAEGFHGRAAVFAARDRCGDAIDRIRCVRTDRFKYIRNFEPQRPYTQRSGYKTLQYPVITLLEVLHERGALTPVQARFMAAEKPVEELYDLVADPHETKNLADDPQYAGTLRELRTQLRDWIEETDDRGTVPEGDAAYFEDLMAEKQAYFERAMRRRGLDPELSPQDYLQWWEDQLGITGDPAPQN
ncbi:Choline-sulfatase [Maioricimonas rarisocia]|uniref:Choline-sulfatase n=1 Tax=Maioricimonas rarisocia TaxID=2528026 RepID=A0A517Z7T7_9PLAN|nr:sulfatase [Maioricimonas rarisocia]QDU38536.1 Choline-sulfatase [Maioricimonas rarisocia]